MAAMPDIRPLMEPLRRFHCSKQCYHFDHNQQLNYFNYCIEKSMEKLPEYTPLKSLIVFGILFVST